MKHKLICLVAMGAIVLTGLNLQASSIQGRVIKGPQTGVVELFAFKDFLSWQTNKIDQAEITNGEFVLNTKITNTSLFRIKLKGKSFDLYMEPDGDYLVELRPEGLLVLKESLGQLNAKIKQFEVGLESIQPHAATRGELFQKVHHLRQELKVEPNYFVKSYGLIKLLQRENLIFAVKGPVRTKEQHLAQSKSIQSYADKIDLNNPATGSLLDELGTNLLVLSDKPPADCWKDHACYLEYRLKLTDQIEDPLIRDLLKIRMIQLGNNTKAKRNLVQAENQLHPLVHSSREVVQLVATNVQESMGVKATN